MQGNKVFRQAVLDRLASPEQLHTLMQVTDAKGWLALLGCGVMLATAVVWGILGRIPTKVEASGILLYSGGLADVVALGQGQISALEVEVGDTITKGQVIAEVAQPELAEQIKAHKSRLLELKANYERAKVQGGRDVNLRMQASAEEKRSLESSAAAAEARTRELRERLDSQQRLFEKGLVTKETLDQTRESLRSSELTTQTVQSNVQRLIVDNFSAQRANEVALTGETMQVQETQRQIELLEEKFEQNSRIVSTYQGRVIEVRAMVGDVVAPGKPVVSLELMGEKGTIEALLYVDSRQGKTLRPGMEVQLSPSIVKKERHGLMLGRVRTVESFPSTRQGMMRVLHNEQLVDSFLAETNGTPIGVRAELERDPATPSGYRWSSGEGPDVVLTSGTRVVGYVTTRTQRPIALVFPALDVGK
jgi:HlyD family secretion protein